MRFDPIERAHLALSAGAVAASFAMASPRFASSVALGVALEAVNFRALHASSRRLFAGEIAGSGPWVGTFAVRFVLLAVAIGLALHVGANPLGLTLGLSVIVPAVVAVAWRLRPPVRSEVWPEAPPPDDPSWERWSPWLARERAGETEDEDGAEGR